MPDSEQGTRLDVDKPPILHQKLDGHPHRRASLHLIKEDQGLTRRHRLAGIGAQVGDRCNSLYTRGSCPQIPSPHSLGEAYTQKSG